MSPHYQLIATIPSVTATPGCLAFSPNGELLASCSPGLPLLVSRCADGSGVVDISSGEHVRVLTWNILEPRELICGFETGAIAFLRLINDKVSLSQRAIQAHDGAVNYITASPLGPLIATAATRGSVKLWEKHPRSGRWEKLRPPSLPSQLGDTNSTKIMGLEFLQGTGHLVVSHSHQILCYDAYSGQLLWDIPLRTTLTHSAIAPDKKHLVVLSMTSPDTEILSIYAPPDSLPVTTWPLSSRSNVPLSVFSLSSSDLTFAGMICSSSKGSTCLTDLWSGQTLTNLCHDAQEDVNVVATFFDSDTKIQMVATSIMSKDGSGSIKIWRQVSNIDQYARQRRVRLSIPVPSGKRGSSRESLGVNHKRKIGTEGEDLTRLPYDEGAVGDQLGRPAKYKPFPSRATFAAGLILAVVSFAMGNMSAGIHTYQIIMDSSHYVLESLRSRILPAVQRVVCPPTE